MTTILKTDPQRPSPEVLRMAAEILRGGGLVAFPTETVYGLGAVVFNEAAVKKIFSAKMRPPDNPLIVHVSDISMLEEVAVNVPRKAHNLMETFWPGPLTLILPKHPNVPKTVTGGHDTIAVRMPAHPVAKGLIDEVGVPLAAPSANLTGKPSPTTADHVIKDLYGRVDAIIDAGETIYGVESTVVNILAEPPVLLRPGAYAVEDLERVLGERIIIPDFARGYGEAENALAPGMKYRHYSPETPIILIDPSSSDVKKMVKVVRDTALEYINKGYRVCIIATFENLDEYSSISWNATVLGLGSWKNAFEIAKNLFKILRSLDDLNCDIAIIEGVQEKGLGLTVMNRLRKASKTIIKA